MFRLLAWLGIKLEGYSRSAASSQLSDLGFRKDTPVDLDFRYGCTPAWWQLWKGMYEVGVDLVVPQHDRNRSGQ